MRIGLQFRLRYRLCFMAPIAERTLRYYLATDLALGRPTFCDDRTLLHFSRAGLKTRR